MKKAAFGSDFLFWSFCSLLEGSDLQRPVDLMQGLGLILKATKWVDLNHAPLLSLN